MPTHCWVELASQRLEPDRFPGCERPTAELVYLSLLLFLGGWNSLARPPPDAHKRRAGWLAGIYKPDGRQESQQVGEILDCAQSASVKQNTPTEHSPFALAESNKTRTLRDAFSSPTALSSLNSTLDLTVQHSHEFSPASQPAGKHDFFLEGRPGARAQLVE